jgi:hypothetical protein
MSDNASRKVLEFPVGDFPERLDVAYRAAQEALKDTTARTMNEGDPYLELKAEYDALRDESQQASREAKTYVVLREISRNDWRKIKADHPPRTDADAETVKADRVAGFNVDTAEDDLVFAALEEPRFESRAAFDEWAGQLGAGKFASIAHEAYLFTMEARRDPKLLPASPTRNDS